MPSKYRGKHIPGGGGGSIDLEAALSWRTFVNFQIQKLYEDTPDVILTTTGATDLNTAIAGLADGELLEVQTDATYSPIDIVAGKEYRIRVAYGYNPVISGDRCIRLRSGCSHVIISGFTISTYTLGIGRDVNGEGQAITFEDHNMICDNLIFHNLAIKQIGATGSACLLSYHQSKSGDNYQTANVYPTEFSERIAFVDCMTYGASSGIEHAAFTCRGIDFLYFNLNKIDGQDDPFGSSDARGIQAQNCLNVLIENNSLLNFLVGNGEGIKVDKLGSPTYQNTCWINRNFVRLATEGIDVDDAGLSIVENNRVWGCETEGISLDDSSKGIIRNNLTFYNYDGIRCENLSVYELHGNVSYDNTNKNIRLDDGGTPDSTNSYEPLYSDGAVGPIMTFQTRWIDASSDLIKGTLAGVANPTFTAFQGNTKEYAFSINDEIFTSIPIPHGYLVGTVPYFHIHFTTNGTDTNTVKWQIDYTSTPVGSSFPSASSFTLELAPTGTAYTHVVIEQATGLSASLLQPDSHFTCRVKRITNGGTDNTDTVFGLKAELHIQVDNLGTFNRYSPFNNRV